MDYAAEPETFSTTLDTDAGPSGAGGGHIAIEQAPEPASLRADLEAVFNDDGNKELAKDAEPDAKAKPSDDGKEPEAKDDKPAKDEKPEAKTEEKKDEVKPERPRAEDGKFARNEQKDEQPKEGRKLVEAPQSFLPQAKDVWRNTPHAVQAEVARLVQESTERDEQTRATVERYESIRQYDDLARTNGRDLRESLEKMSHVENLLQRNPLAGLNAILSEIGPRKADGQPFSLYEVAQFVAQQDPQNYQQMVAQGQQPQQPQEDPRVAQLEQRLAQMQEEQAQASIVEPFAREHPRFNELERDIAFFLQSGRIPTSLSPQDRLAAAYDMAERINPPSYVDDQPANGKGPAEQRRADDDFSGSKSIKSSPGSVTETYEPQAKRGESARDSLLAEMRRLNR